MSSTSPLSDAASQASNLVSNILSSIQSSYGPDSETEGLFSTLLSQYEIPGLPETSNAPPPPTSETNSNQNQAAVTAQSEASQNNENSSLPATQSAQNAAQAQSSNSKSTPRGAQQNDNDTTENNVGSANSSNASTGGNAQNDSVESSSASASRGSPKASSQTVSKTSSSSVSSQQETDATDSSPSGFVNLSNDTAALPGASQNASTKGKGTATDGSLDASASDDTSTSSSDDTSGSDLTTAAALLLAQLSQQPATTKTGGNAASGSKGSSLLDLLSQLDALANSGQLLKNGASDTSNLLAGNLATGGTSAASAKGSASLAGGSSESAELKGLFASIADLEGSTDNLTASSSGSAQQASASPAEGTATGTSSSNSTKSTTDKTSIDNFLSLFNAQQPTTDLTPLPVATPLALSALTGTSTGSSSDAELGSNSAQQENNAALQATASNGQQNPEAASLPSGLQQTSNPYDFASQLSAARAEKGGQTGLPPVIDQVMLQLSRGVSKDGSSDMTIQLKPAELGRVDVKLSISSEGKVQGTVTADNSSTLGMLVKDQRGLERALQEAGFHADPGSLQFNLRSDQQSSGQGQSFGNGSSNSKNDGSSFDLATASTSANQTDTYYLTPGGVNMRV